MKASHQSERHRIHWKANLRLTTLLLSLWFVFSFGAGILFRQWLDRFHLGGAPLGFWMAQQGAIYVFVVLVFVYAWAMNRLEMKLCIADDQAGKT